MCVCVCCIQDVGYIDLVLLGGYVQRGPPVTRHPVTRERFCILCTLRYSVLADGRGGGEEGREGKRRERLFFSLHATLRRAFKCDRCCFLLSNSLILTNATRTPFFFSFLFCFGLVAGCCYLPHTTCCCWPLFRSLPWVLHAAASAASATETTELGLASLFRPAHSAEGAGGGALYHRRSDAESTPK